MGRKLATEKQRSPRPGDFAYLLLRSFGVSPGIVHWIQEFFVLHAFEFVGVVRGIGNSHGEVTHDPRPAPHQSANRQRLLRNN